MIYSSNGKFFCFVVESNRELPSLFVYNIRENYPEFDRFWAYEHRKKNPDFKIKASDLNGQTEGSGFERNLYSDTAGYNKKLDGVANAGGIALKESTKKVKVVEMIEEEN